VKKNRKGGKEEKKKEITRRITTRQDSARTAGSALVNNPVLCSWFLSGAIEVWRLRLRKLNRRNQMIRRMIESELNSRKRSPW